MREVGDLAGQPFGFGILAFNFVRQFAQESNLGQAAADFIVHVTGDAAPFLVHGHLILQFLVQVW